MCLRVAPLDACHPDVTARVIIGDMGGYACVLDIRKAEDAEGKQHYRGCVLARWLAHAGGRTLSAFWLHTADGHLPATADALGALKVWRLGGSEAQELASAQLKCRVSAAATYPQADVRMPVIVCGDQNGNVFAFGFPHSGGELATLGSVAHAHASKIVTFAGCTAHGWTTAGGDGYVCSFAMLPSGGVARTRRLHAAAITAVEALHDDDLAVTGSTCIAAGVTSNDVVVMDLRGACELLRVPCGGWRRPHSFLLGPAGRFVVACVRDGSVHLHRRWPEDTPTGPEAHRSLRASHHGREVHAAVFVPGADADASKCALITGAEDGTVCRLFVDPRAAPQVDKPVMLAQTAGGTAVRALSLICDASGGLILVSAGAKEVLMCWTLKWTAAGELTTHLLAAHCPPSDAFNRAWRAVANAPADPTFGDQRYMALCSFVIGHELFAVASSSDGTLSMWALALTEVTHWRFVSVLYSGSCPVLALECVTAADGSTWLFSGATDGTVAVWDLSSAVRVAHAAPAAQAASSFPTLSPSLLLQNAHQSGVNSLSVARAPDALACGAADAWMLISGGDDQAVNTVVLELAASCRVTYAVRKPGAHASGVKGVWTDGTAVHTVSLDQRVSSWRLEASPTTEAVSCHGAHLDAPWLARIGDAVHVLGSRVDMQHWWSSGTAEQHLRLVLADSSLTEVPDVETLAALPCAAGCIVAVAGRGVQVFA
jgi:WD40 repeat protein